MVWSSIYTWDSFQWFSDKIWQLITFEPFKMVLIIFENPTIILGLINCWNLLICIIPNARHIVGSQKLLQQLGFTRWQTASIKISYILRLNASLISKTWYVLMNSWSRAASTSVIEPTLYTSHINRWIISKVLCCSLSFSNNSLL